MTNDKAATPEIISWAHRLRNECLGRKTIELFDITAKRAVEVANQFDAMQFKIEALQSEIAALRGLLVKGDSYLSLLRHRYIRTDTPDDLRQDVDQVIGAIRNASKGAV